MTHKLFVYGTLQKESSLPAVLMGATTQSDAPYKTIAPDPDGQVTGQVIDVDNIRSYDRVEGYREYDLEGSLYWRLPIAESGVEVYVGNPEEGMETWGRSWDVDYDLDSITEYLENEVQLVVVGREHP